MYTDKTFNFRQDLMAHLLTLDNSKTAELLQVPDLPSNIGERYCPKPSKEEAVENLLSRF